MWLKWNKKTSALELLGLTPDRTRRVSGGRKFAGAYKYYSVDLGHRKNLILRETKEKNYKDVEDMAYRMEFTYDDIIDTLDIKYNATKNRFYPTIWNI